MSNGGIIGPVQNPIISVASTTSTFTFTSSGTYTSGPQAKLVQAFMVAGGGGGRSSTFIGAGGGGGGIFQSCSLSISAGTPYPITVGGGGTASCSGPGGQFGALGGNGTNSTGLGQTASGGYGNTPTNVNIGGDYVGGIYTGGASPGGGGAGAGGNGAAGTCAAGGIGGSGLNSTLSGAPVNYSGGGAGASNSPNVSSGTDGGSPGASLNTPAGTATVNRGGGGGGFRSGFSCGSNRASSAGGSGIVFIKELTKSVAPGVWSLSEQYNFKKSGNWS